MDFEQPGVLAALFENNPEPIVVYNRDGFFVGANSAALELVGRPLEEMLGTHITDAIPNRDREMVLEAANVARAGESYSLETRIVHRDGTRIPVECFLFPQRSAADTGYIFVIVRDMRALKTAQAGMQTHQERFRSLFEYHPDGIVAVNADGTISRINAALESTTGYYNERMEGKRWTEIVAPESLEAAEDAFREGMRGEANELEAQFLDRLGNRIDMQLKVVPLHVGNQTEGAYVIAKNITAQHSAERVIAQQNERVRALYLTAATDASPEQQIDQVLHLGTHWFGFEFAYVARIADGKLTTLNSVGPAHSVVAGMQFPLEAAIARFLSADRESLFIPDLDMPPWNETVTRFNLPWKSYFGMLVRVNNEPYGAIIFADRDTRPAGLSESDRDLARLMNVFIAASIERSEHAQRIEQLAFHDALTGLPNRVLFDDRIRQTMATAKRYSRGFAVMFLDLDRFKEVNDELGHPVGDLLLQKVAARLREVLRESDTVARFGGDEFVVLQPIVNGPDDASDMARKIVTEMQRPYDLQGKSRVVRTSIGIALYPQDAGTVEELMEKADKALYRAKRGGRNRWTFFNEAESLRKWPGLLRTGKKGNSAAG